LVLNGRYRREDSAVKEILPNLFGQRVRKLRNQNGLTQEELAGRSSVSLKYIQRIEGKCPPDIGIESMGKIAEGLKMPLWKLLKME
jgi:transcriptional regulator with XRE-family HTH domain